MTKNFIFGSLTIASLTLASCGSNQKDAATYNNEIMTVINGSEEHITEMNTAMTTADYAKAEEVRTKWDKSLDSDIKKVEDLGDFNGDAKLQQAVLSGLKRYKKIVTESYPKLIEIRTSNTPDPDTEERLLNEINTAFENMGNGVNAAADEFESKNKN